MFDNEIVGLMLFFFALYCGLWAQKTHKNYWLWFFAGFFFAPVTGIVLMVKNSKRFPKP